MDSINSKCRKIKVKKSTIIVIIVIVILVLICAFPSIYWHFYYNGGNFRYTVNADGKTCTIVSYDDSDPEEANVNIPSEINGYIVTQIDDLAFMEKNIISVTIPSTVVNIGAGAFANCTSLKAVYGLENCLSIQQIQEKTFFCCESLKSISLPPDLKYIGEQAFLQCYALENIDFPTSLKTIDRAAFFSCTALTKIVFPDGIRKIDSAFAGCVSLNDVIIPASVEELGSGAFMDCSSLKNIHVDDKNTVFSSVNGIVYDKEQSTLWIYPSGRTDDNFSVPEGIKTLVSVSLAYSNLKSIDIPKSVKFLSDKVFVESFDLITINYAGTVQEWKLIQKDQAWDKDSAEYTIYCTDGQISKDGTITYK